MARPASRPSPAASPGPGWTVPVSFAHCTASVATLGFSGTPDPVRGNVYAGRSGVGVDLRLSPDGIGLGPGSLPVNIPLLAVGPNVHRLAARMVQTASGVTPGSFSTPVIVSVTYQ